MNVQTTIMAGAVAALLSSGALAAGAAAQAPAAASTNAAAVKAQTTCPVMGGAIDKSKFVDYEGKRIYVCCGGCIASIKKDPAKYVKQLEAQGITLDKAEAPKVK
jgi:YHS domain-containing protein